MQDGHYVAYRPTCYRLTYHIHLLFNAFGTNRNHIRPEIDNINMYSDVHEDVNSSCHIIVDDIHIYTY
jgi:hypothetical protein